MLQLRIIALNSTAPQIQQNIAVAKYEELQTGSSSSSFCTIHVIYL